MPKSPFTLFRNANNDAPWHEPGFRARRPRAFRIASVTAGVVLSAAAAYAVTNWTVGLNSGSSGEAQSSTVSNLTITAVASPAATNLLFPGANGDGVATITNPNTSPVTIAAVNLPTNTTYAGGFTTSALSTPQTGCSSTTSLVGWNFATSTSGSSHTVTTPLIVGANSTLTVTLTNDITMATTAPVTCTSTYFKMPSLTAVTATAGAGSPTATPTTDGWTA